MLGINIGILPAGYGESTETLVDDQDFIDPYVLEGFSGIGAMGGQVGGIGLALTDLKLGGARTPNYREPNVGPTKGLGKGLLAMLGRSKLDAAPIKMDCGCN